MPIELPVRIVLVNPPGGVVFAVQEGRSELLAPSQAKGGSMTFEFNVRVAEDDRGQGPNFLGSFAQGPRGGRFIYVNSGRHAGQKDTDWDRRAKVPLGGLTWTLVKSALAKRGAVEAHIDGVGRDGGPACGSVALIGKWRVIPSSGSAVLRRQHEP
jgi:hypothetical protein